MNKARRKSLQELYDQISDINHELEVLKNEEEDYFNNMPESIQSGEKGQAAEAAIEAMESAVYSLDEAMESIEEITNQ